MRQGSGIIPQLARKSPESLLHQPAPTTAARTTCCRCTFSRWEGKIDGRPGMRGLKYILVLYPKGCGATNKLFLSLSIDDSFRSCRPKKMPLPTPGTVGSVLYGSPSECTVPLL